MVAEPLERSSGMRVRVAPRVMDIQRRAMVDEPGATVPDEEVRVLGRPVRVGDEAVEPDDRGRSFRVHRRERRGRGRVEHQRPGQEVEPEIATAARPDEVLDLLVRLGVTERGIELHGDEVGHEQPERSSELAAEPLGDQCPGPLPGAAELHDIHPLVVRLDQAWQRAALAERRHVARRRHRPHRAEPTRPRCRPVQVRMDRTSGISTRGLALHDDV